MKSSQPSHARSKLALPHVWTFTTYFTEGFPFSLIRNVSTVFFRDSGMSLEAIGLTSLFGLPWVLKFLWAHRVDSHATKRHWLLVTQAILVALFLGVALLSANRQALPFLAILLFVASIAAATHDIAIDGYYLEALAPEWQARLVGYRTMAYRIALMSGSGVIITIGATMGWPAAFWTSTATMALFLVFHLRFLPRHETPSPGTSAPRLRHYQRPAMVLAGGAMLTVIAYTIMADLPLPITQLASLTAALNLPLLVGSGLLLSMVLIGLCRKKIGAWLARRDDTLLGQALLSFMDRPRIGAILGFIMLVKTGEYMLSIMVAPFVVDLGIKHHYGWISGGIGLPFSIVGAMLGGRLIARHTLQRMILPFLLLQNLTNLIYMGLALLLQPHLPGGPASQLPMGPANLLAVVLVHGFDQFAGGLGTAVLMVFLMRLCQPRFKAAHYAIGTGLMSVSGLYVGTASGLLASWLGYGYFFGASFLCSVPGMLLLFRIPLDEPPAMP